MQYKIPVQIENDDPIVLGLSLKQLIIMMVGGAMAYGTFNSLEPKIGGEVALIPTIVLVLITLFIALFKQYEMTFLPFILALLRFNINFKERYWIKAVDSFSPLDIGIIVNQEKKEDNNIDFKDKMEKIKSLEENLNKI
ncbi:MAG: PrgI family protein [Candidatus Gracilibacteria bacterium]|nr:PrgI family protein [Candidatus Gracilibacteria bacterium]